MSARRKVWDVFLSYARHDANIADVVRGQLASTGLSVFDMRSISHGGNVSDEIRSAMAECFAVVLIVTPSSIRNANIAVEVGAAMAWSKPVYLLADGVDSSELPIFLREYQTLPIARVGEIADRIEREARAFSPEEQQALTRIYTESGVPVDQLALDPLRLQALSQAFNREFKTSLSPERVLQELMRLRKRAKLPKLGRAPASRRIRAG